MKTREEWLGALVNKLRPMFLTAGHPLPKKLRISCSWPSRSALSSNSKRVGEAWPASASADGTRETFISPWLGTAEDVAPVVVHELVHCAITESGHGKAFKTLATQLGLEGKMTATTAGEKLQGTLKTLCKQLGAYPHAQLDAEQSPRKKQTTRMLKCECLVCGCVVRTTKKWLDAVGVPTCGCGGTMHADLPTEDVDSE